jgi:hypothetical protein
MNKLFRFTIAYCIRGFEAIRWFSLEKAPTIGWLPINFSQKVVKSGENEQFSPATFQRSKRPI